MNPMWILLAMQAAGMVVDYFGKEDQKKFGRQGARLEQMGIETNIELTRLQAEDASVAAMKNLRQTLGSQAAYSAALGRRANPAFMAESQNEFNADERTRKINFMSKEAELRAQIIMSKLHQQSSEAKADNDWTKKIFDLIPMSAMSDMFKTGSKPSTTGHSAGGAAAVKTASPRSRNFGMTPFLG